MAHRTENQPQFETVHYSITTVDLNLWYGDFQALKDVTINIKQGIITA